MRVGKNNKIKREKVEDMKPSTCCYCPLTSKRRYNICIHEERKHGKGEKEEKVEDMKPFVYSGCKTYEYVYGFPYSENVHN